MRRLLAFACRAFPPEHRARRSDEVVDTALLAADGSVWRAAREALSLVLAGGRERLRAEPRRSARDGVALLAGLLALVNLAVALGGIALCVERPVVYWSGLFVFRNPYVLDWWWIAFAVAAAGLVLGLARGYRTLALGAALANLGVIGYDAIFLVSSFQGHMRVFADLPALGFPAGWTWLPVAVVLALATVAAPLRRLPLWRLPLALAASVLLVVVSREAAGGSFFFLRWPVAAIVVLALTFGWLAPPLAVVAIGISLAVAPSVVGYLSVSYAYHDPVMKWVAAPGLALGILLPLAYLTRRRLT